MTNSERKKIRREGWFRDGADAYHRVVPGATPGTYACPMCLREFSPEQIDALNDDHVPSRKLLGPKVVVLTCKDRCNSHSGGVLQTHMIEREKHIDLVRGTMNHELQIEVQIDGVWMDATVVSKGTNINVKISDTPRNSRNMPGGEEEFAARIQGGANITIRRGPGYNERRARVSVLREGYLAAFAAFGYSLAFSPALDIVRRQIKSPDEEIIPRFLFLDVEAAGPERNIALAVNPPALAGGVCVRIGRYLVVLPGTQPDCYQRLVDDSEESGRQELMTLAPWPTRPRYDLDYDRVELMERKSLKHDPYRANRLGDVSALCSVQPHPSSPPSTLTSADCGRVDRGEGDYSRVTIQVVPDPEPA